MEHIGKLRRCISFATNSTLRRVLQKITDCPIDSVSYRSHLTSLDWLIIFFLQSVQLVVFPFDVYVELPYSFQSQLFSLHENLHGVLHEVIGYLDCLWCHCGREHTYLHMGRQCHEDIMDLFRKAPVAK